MSDEARKGLLHCMAIEVAHGSNPKLWQADEVTDEDLAAFALAEVAPDEARAAFTARRPFVPRQCITRRPYDADQRDYDEEAEAHGITTAELLQKGC